MRITVRIKNNYGQNVIYPVCDNADKFAWIAGTKTLTEIDNCLKRDVVSWGES